MSLLADLQLMTGDVSLDDVEKKMASGDLPPAGVHHAVLTQVGPIPNTDAGGWKLTFEILAGAGKGATVEEVLWRKSKDDDAKKNATLGNRVLLFGTRLGLFKEGANGKPVQVEGKHDLCDCLGATCFIEVEHKKRKYEGKDGSEKETTEAKVTFGGLLKPDDKKCKDVPRGTGAAAAAATGSKSAGKPADNLEGL